MKSSIGLQVADLRAGKPKCVFIYETEMKNNYVMKSNSNVVKSKKY